MNLQTENINELERVMRNSKRPEEQFAARQVIKRLSAVKRAGGLHYVSGDQEPFTGMNKISYQYQVMGSEMGTATTI